MQYYSDTCPRTSAANTLDLTEDELITPEPLHPHFDGFPFTVWIDPLSSRQELLDVLSGSGTPGDPYIIDRAQGTTLASPHDAGASIYHAVSSADFKKSREHEAATTNFHGISNVDDIVMRDKLVFNVQDYGVLPGGDASVNAAGIAAARAAMATFSGGIGGGTIFFPAGNYLTDTSITVTSGESYKGAGQVSTFLHGTIAGPVFTSASNGGADPLTNYVNIEDMYIKNDSTNVAARAAYFHQMSNLTMARCTLASNAGGAGSSVFKLRAVIVSTFDHVRHTSNAAPDFSCILEEANNRISFRTVSFCNTKSGALVLGGISVGFWDCHFEQLTGASTSNPAGLWVTGCTGGTVQDCYFESIGNIPAIAFATGVDTSRGWSISDNFVTNAGSPMLDIGALKFGRIGPNYLKPGSTSPNGNGLTIGSGCQDLIVQDQYLHSGSGAAVSVNTAATRIFRVTGAAKFGYFAASSDTADWSFVTGEAWQRFFRTAAGAVSLGGGAAAPDTTLSRSAAGVWAMTGTGAGAGALTLGGGFQTAHNLVTGATTLTQAHSVVTATAAAPYSITLPTAVGCAGREYTIIKTDNNANLITIATTSAQNINGATTYVGLTAQWKYVKVISNGAQWVIVGSN